MNTAARFVTNPVDVEEAKRCFAVESSLTESKCTNRLCHNQFAVHVQVFINVLVSDDTL